MKNLCRNVLVYTTCTAVVYFYRIPGNYNGNGYTRLHWHPFEFWTSSPSQQLGLMQTS